MTRTNKAPRVEDYIVVGGDIERIVRVTVSKKGKTKGQKVAVTVHRRIPLDRLSHNRTLNNRKFFNLKLKLA